MMTNDDVRARDTSWAVALSNTACDRPKSIHRRTNALVIGSLIAQKMLSHDILQEERDTPTYLMAASTEDSSALDKMRFSLKINCKREMLAGNNG